LAIDFSTKDSRSRVDDYRSTYVAQLQAMHNITPGQAEAVAKQYTSWRRLYEAYEALPTERQRQNMLAASRWAERSREARRIASLAKA
jgi:ubiquinone/menaquinone biosynthesis C-methylase UbiE